jgi:hypothetical protein
MMRTDYRSAWRCVTSSALRYFRRILRELTAACGVDLRLSTEDGDDPRHQYTIALPRIRRVRRLADNRQHAKNRQDIHRA